MKKYLWILYLALLVLSSSIAASWISSPSTLAASAGVTVLILNGILVFNYFKQVLEKTFNNIEREKKDA